MDTLPLHIEFLLTRHDCVIVPGLGAFIAVETEGAFSDEEGVIRPRRREISFNGSVVTDDGLLAHSIARRDRISYEEAHRKLVLMTARMKQELHLEGETSVGRVGRLLKDSEGMLTFQPRFSAAEDDVFEDIKFRSASSDASETGASQNAAESHEVESGDGSRTVRVAPDVYVFTVSKRLAHAAAMIVMVLGVCLSLLLPINHDMEQRASVMPIERLLRPLDRQHEEIRVKADTLDHTSPTMEHAEAASIEKSGAIH